MTSSNPAPVPPPASLALPRRRWTAYFAIPIALMVAGSGLFSLLWLPYVLGTRAGSVFGGLFALVGVVLGAGLIRGAWKALTQSGPALIVDADGITDRFHLNSHIPWSAIQKATIDYGRGRRLMLSLRQGATLPDGRSFETTLWRRARRLFDGGDMGIPLGGLVYRPHVLRAALAGHLARAQSNANAAEIQTPRQSDLGDRGQPGTKGVLFSSQSKGRGR